MSVNWLALPANLILLLSRLSERLDGIDEEINVKSRGIAPVFICLLALSCLEEILHSI
jgi:hypothetical protein